MSLCQNSVQYLVITVVYYFHHLGIKISFPSKKLLDCSFQTSNRMQNDTRGTSFVYIVALRSL